MTPSDSDPKAPLPAVRNDPTIPRTALERVLARATELQSEGTDAPEAVSESRLMEIAREVGIDTANLRQALAEERSRFPLQEAEHGVILDALGPATMSAQRLVPGTTLKVLAKLDAWMPKMEALSVRRRATDRVSWEPRRDPLGNFLRSLGMGGRRLDLVRLDQVVASVNAVDASRSVVRFDTESHAARRAQRTTFNVIALALIFAATLGAIPLRCSRARGRWRGHGGDRRVLRRDRVVQLAGDPSRLSADAGAHPPEARAIAGRTRARRNAAAAKPGEAGHRGAFALTAGTTTTLISDRRSVIGDQ
jgi:hypothetical protein